MNFTVANHNNRQMSKGFIHYDNVEFEDIPEMITSGFAYASAKFKNNHRLDENYEGEEDVLILDIDEAVTLDQAKILFSKYTNFIITSKSHQIEKNGIICDRYRVFIKLESTLQDAELRVELVNNIFTNFPFVDKKCKNPSRFYFASPEDAKVFYNEGKDMPIIYSKIHSIEPEEQKEEKETIEKTRGVYILQELEGIYVNEYGETLEDDYVEGEYSYESMIKGARTVFDTAFYKGNANHCIFSVACMLLNNGMDKDEMADFILKEVEGRSGYPFSKTMAAIKSAIRTI